MKAKSTLFRLTILSFLLSITSCESNTEKPITGVLLPGVYVTLKPGSSSELAFELVNSMKDDFWYGKMTGFLFSELPEENIEIIRASLTGVLKAKIGSITYNSQLKLIILDNITFEEIQKQSTQTTWKEIVKKYQLKEQQNKSWFLEVYTINNSKDEFWMKKFKEYNFVQDSYRLGGV